MEQEFTLKLTLEQLNLIAAGLGELPFRVSHQMINEISRQVGEQQQPVPEEATSSKK